MVREISIIDKTNGVRCDITLDDEKQFLQVYGIDHKGEKNLIVEKIEYPYKKPPFVIREGK